MRNVIIFFLIINFLTIQQLIAQYSSLHVTASVSKDLLNNFQSKGRIFLFIAEPGSREPRLNTWPNKSNRIFATNLCNWDSSKPFSFDGTTELIKSVDISLDNLPNGKYTVQVLWDQDFSESRINAPGNLYGKPTGKNLAQKFRVKSGHGPAIWIIFTSTPPCVLLMKC